MIDGTRADEDAVLVREVFDLPDALNDMSPVAFRAISPPTSSWAG